MAVNAARETLADGQANFASPVRVEIHYVRVIDASAAVDAYIGTKAREGWSAATIATNRRLLYHFADSLDDLCVHEIELRHYERWLNRWLGASPSTMASGVSLVRGFSRFCQERGWSERDVAATLKRPKRLRAEDLAVVTVSSDEVRLMLAACEDWQELLCITTAAYLGSRRAALARIRRGDVDLVNGHARFLEKGGKEVVKPLPHEYHDLLRAAERDGVWKSADDYLIPNRRPNAVRRKERSDKIVWQTVKTVAARAGVTSHVHALRAAFAVAFDETNPREVLALKDLMGHARLETTLVYLRRRDKQKGMEAARNLKWGIAASSRPGALRTP